MTTAQAAFVIGPTKSDWDKEIALREIVEEINYLIGQIPEGGLVGLHAASHELGGDDELALDASQIVSGTFADARISESSVTQYEAALDIDWDQVFGTPTTLAGYGITDAYTKTEVDTALALKLNRTGYTLGDIVYANAPGALVALPGQITATRKFLSQTGNGVASGVPSWQQPAFADLTGTITYAQLPTGGGTWANGGDLTITSGAVYFPSIIGGSGGGETPLIIGWNTSANIYGNPNTPGALQIPSLQLIGNVASPQALIRWNASVSGGVALALIRNRSATPGEVATPNVNGDRIATIATFAADGTDLATAVGYLRWIVDGTVTTNRIPGSLQIHLAAGTADDDIRVTARFRADGSFVSGLSDISSGAGFERNRLTGTSVVSPATIRLRSTSVGSDWATGPTNVFAQYDVYADTTGGPGASVRARWGAFMENLEGSKVGIAIQTSDASGLNDVVRMFSDLRSQFRGDVVLGQGELTATPLTGIARGAAAAGTNIVGADVLYRPGAGTGSGGSGKVRVQVAGVNTYSPARPALVTSALSTPAAGAQTVRTITITVPSGLIAPAMFITIESISTAVPTSVVSDLSGAFTVHDTNANGTNDSVEIWKLVAPVAGTHTITITLPVARRFVSCASLWQYVDQTTPLGAAVKATGNTQNATVNITGVTADTLLDVVAKVDSTETIAAAAGQTEVQNNASSSGTASLNVRGGTSYKTATGGVDTVSWTWSSTNRQWAIMVVPIKLATTLTPNLFEDAIIVTNDKATQMMGNAAVNGKTPAAQPDYTITNPSTLRAINVSTGTLGDALRFVASMAQDLIDIGYFK